MPLVRILLEVTHGLVWLYLIYAVCCYPKEKLWPALLILASIPLFWLVLGECPLTALENQLSPLSSDEFAEFGARNRVGMQIRKYLQMPMEVWDNALSTLTCVLLLAVIVRICA